MCFPLATGQAWHGEARGEPLDFQPFSPVLTTLHAPPGELVTLRDDS